MEQRNSLGDNQILEDHQNRSSLQNEMLIKNDIIEGP